MTITTYTPLGDSLFTDIGYTSPNTFGAVIGFQTDMLGGDAPAQIPNPLAPVKTVAYAFYECGPVPVPEPGLGMLLAFVFVAVLVGFYRRSGKVL